MRGPVSVVLLVLGMSLAVALPAAAQQPYRADISRTSGGVPHIRANDWGSLGFGAGYAYAEDNLCTLANEIVTVSAERSRWFGPDRFTIASAKVSDRNIDSDFFWQQVKDRRVVERLIAQRAPHGPKPEARRTVRGYAAGYNAFLRAKGRARLPDPRCRGKQWVRPIRPIDLWRRYYQLALLAGSGQFIGDLATTRPPSAVAAGANTPSPDEAAAWWRSMRPGAQPIGSNAIGVGSAASRSRRGLVLGNPHFPWIGGERFYNFHLTLPGKLNVQGASLQGVPAINIGFNDRVAWSHTVSTAWRFTPFRLQLAPGNPRAYLVDGESVPMTSRTVRVRARTKGGGLETRRHTFWYSRYGPIVNVAQAGYIWDSTHAYALGDVNANNMRVVNVWLDMNRARSVDDLIRSQSRNQGVPWVNTIAADRRGVALYQDNSVVPAVSRAKIDACIPAGLPQVVYAAAGIVTLDGSRSACNWANERGAVVPGILAPRNLPILKRRDYVQNSNDSYWLSNPARPLTGFSPIIGSEGTELNLRTRWGLRMIATRLAGGDGLPGRKFTVGNLRSLWQRNASEGGRLLKDQLAALCDANPSVDVGGGSVVDVRPACPVIRAWDATARLDSRGSWLFSAWWSHSDSLFSDPFDPAQPLTTPNRLDTGAGNIRALGLAVQDLNRHGLPLDASVKQAQYALRHGRRIPIPGCDTGCYQAIGPSLDPAADSESQGVPVRYGQVLGGSSYVMQVELTPRGPRGTTILTYSESENPRSPHSGDQTRLFSEGRWLPIRYSARAISRDPKLRRYSVRARR